MSRIRAVLFDLDGTLIDSAPDLAAAANEQREAHGLPAVPYEALRRMVGSGARGMVGVAFGLEPGVGLAQATPWQSEPVTLGSPAIKVMTDLTLVKAATIQPNIPLRQAEQAARDAALLATQRYASGLVDFQTVLDTQRTLLGVQDSAATAQTDWASGHVRVLKALGIAPPQEKSS